MQKEHRTLTQKSKFSKMVSQYLAIYNNWSICFGNDNRDRWSCNGQAFLVSFFKSPQEMISSNNMSGRRCQQLEGGGKVFLGLTVAHSLPWPVQIASDPASPCCLLFIPLPLTLEFPSCFLSNSLYSSQISKDSTAFLVRCMILMTSTHKRSHPNVGAPLSQPQRVQFLKDKIQVNRYLHIKFILVFVWSVD